MNMVDNATQDFLRDWIHNLVMAGYDGLNDLKQSFVESLDGEGVKNHKPWLDELQNAWNMQVEAEKGWSDTTVNDIITLAFNEMREANIVALENAGYTQSDGWEDIHDARQNFPNSIGGAFFHGQDVERGVAGQGLYIRFGSFEGKSKDGDIANIIFKILKKHNIDVTWSGSAEETIQINPFEWRKRNSTLSTMRKSKLWWKFWT